VLGDQHSDVFLGIESVPWESLRVADPGTTAARVPVLLRKLARPRSTRKAAAELEVLLGSSGLVSEATLYSIPFLIELVSDAPDAGVRHTALVLLERLARGTPLRPELWQGGVPISDREFRQRMRGALRPGIDAYYRLCDDQDSVLDALNLIFFIEGHSGRFLEVLDSTEQGGDAKLGKYVRALRVVPTKVDHIDTVDVYGETTIAREDLVRIATGAGDEPGRPRYEMLWAPLLGERGRRLERSPLHVQGVARGDIFQVDGDHLGEVVERSGDIALQITTDDGISRYLLDTLSTIMSAHGGYIDARDHWHIAATLPSPRGVEDVAADLDGLVIGCIIEEWRVANPDIDEM